MSQWMSKTQKQNTGINLPDVMKDVRPVDRSNDLVPFGSAPLPGAGVAAVRYVPKKSCSNDFYLLE